MTSRKARFAGGATLVAIFALLEALVLEMRGVSPTAVLGALIGGFLGLVSLALEIGMLQRAARTFYAQGLQTTFISFVLRMAVVGPLTLLFTMPACGVDAHAFAISYCSTFFLYLCWLTWETYHAPVHYRPKAQTKKPAAPVVRINRPSHQAAPGSIVPSTTVTSTTVTSTTWGGLR